MNDMNANTNKSDDKEMTIKEQITNLAEEMLRRNGLLATGWRLDWFRSYAYGRCDHLRQMIELDESNLCREPYEVRNTVCHEIAHALVGRGHGHDAVWLCKALELGMTQ